MAGNNKHIAITASTDTVPLSQSVTGTSISAVNGLNLKVVGVGTTFLTDFQVGDWLFIPAQKACRKIINIVSDTELTLEEAFPSAVTGVTTFKKTPKSTYSMVSYIFDASGGSVDGVATLGGGAQAATIEQGSKGSYRSERIEPIVIEATGTCNVVVYQG